MPSCIILPTTCKAKQKRGVSEPSSITLHARLRSRDLSIDGQLSRRLLVCTNRCSACSSVRDTTRTHALEGRLVCGGRAMQMGWGGGNQQARRGCTAETLRGSVPGSRWEVGNQRARRRPLQRVTKSGAPLSVWDDGTRAGKPDRKERRNGRRGKLNSIGMRKRDGRGIPFNHTNKEEGEVPSDSESSPLTWGTKGRD